MFLIYCYRVVADIRQGSLIGNFLTKSIEAMVLAAQEASKCADDIPEEIEELAAKPVSLCS